jgi:hypothetical protein
VYIPSEALRASLRDLQAARADVGADSDQGKELAALIRDVQEASDKIIGNAASRQVEREKFEKWNAIIPLCRKALDTVNQLAMQIDTTDAAATEASQRVHVAEQNLGLALSAKPTADAYPTQGELREHEEQVARFRRIFEARKADAHRATEAQRTLHANLLAAQRELAGLRFTERQLRPRSEQAPAWQIGTAIAGI